MLSHLRQQFPSLSIEKTSSSLLLINGAPGCAPAPRFLSQVAVAAQTAYLSGQLGLGSNGQLVPGGTEAETHQIFNNIEAILGAVRLELSAVLMARVFLTNWDEFSTFNAIYLERMGTMRPAREAVAVSKLALEASVEITVTAHIPSHHALLAGGTLA